MKKLYLAVAAIFFSILSPVCVQAQYSSIVNQAANMLQTAVIGGFSYKGFVDASYTGGFGDLKANFVGVSTVQGFQYANWFFMGAGLGVDLVFSEVEDRYYDYEYEHKTRSNGVMIPIFTDFRFNIGSRRLPHFSSTSKPVAHSLSEATISQLKTDISQVPNIFYSNRRSA